MESSKKQRNKKNQNERHEQKDVKHESNKEDTTTETKATKHQADRFEFKPEPQPQRAPRRTRNGTVTPCAIATTVSLDCGPTQLRSAPRQAGVKEVVAGGNKEFKENKCPLQEEEVKVAKVSNLKRETEEIEKLNKKFTKRKITSNWHRYSAPEGSAEQSGVDGSAPADFSDLLQVPVSRGGHLQLKDEQDWSSGSGSTLGGYFALDLKKLNQSLACIPLYDQLHIPKHMFTVEEIEELDDLARENKKLFESENDITNMTVKLDSISLSHKIATEVASKITSVLKEDPFVIDIGSQGKQALDPCKNDNLEEKYIENPIIDHSVEKQMKEPKPQIRNINEKTYNNDLNLVTNRLLDDIQKDSQENKSIEKSNIKDESIDNGLKFNKNMEQLPLIAKSIKPKSPMGNLNNPVDDDDDLDFLLSLSTPVSTNIKSIATNSTSSKVKGSNSSEEKNDSQKSAVGQSSELDDWLDTVLED